MSSAHRLPILRDFISHIFLDRSQKKMLGINTPGMITLVTNASAVKTFPFRNFIYKEFISDTVGKARHAINVEATITSTTFFGSPKPASCAIL